MGPWQVLPPQVRMDLAVIAMNGFSTLSRYLEQEPQMHFMSYPWLSFGEGRGLFHRYSQHILSHYFEICFFIGIIITVFANGPEDRGSIPVEIIPKT